MTTSQLFYLNEHSQRLGQSANSAAELSSPGSTDGFPADIVVKIAGRTFVCNQFADCVAVKQTGGKVLWSPIVTCAAASDRSPVSYVVGLYLVLAVHFGTGSVTESLRMHRSEAEDRGFFRTQFISLGEEMLFVYESGIAKFDESGTIAWHHRLRGDDELRGIREGAVMLVTETPDGEYEWSITIRDGTVHDRRQ